eukprot:364146-Chlamydomonas_euryale.AAC.7
MDASTGAHMLARSLACVHTQPSMHACMHCVELCFGTESHATLHVLRPIIARVPPPFFKAPLSSPATCPPAVVGLPLARSAPSLPHASCRCRPPACKVRPLPAACLLPLSTSRSHGPHASCRTPLAVVGCLLPLFCKGCS